MPNLHTTTVELFPTAPFDFAKSVAFLGEFMPAAGEQNLDRMQITKATRLDGVTVVFRVRSTGTTEAPHLMVELFSTDPLPADLVARLSQRIGFFLSIGDDLAPFYALGQADPAFAPVIQQMHGYHQVKFLTPYENAAWAIMSTRTGMPQAKQIKDRFVAAYGDVLEVDGRRYAAFPEAHDVLGASITDLEQVVGLMRRAEFIQSASRAFATVDPAWLLEADYDEVKAWLLRIKGIGAWGSSFILIRALGRLDRLDAPEWRLMEQVARRYSVPRDEAITRQLAAHYGAYQGYWAHYLRAAG
ncbi:MAG: DNA-3-methyladenine glycosylase 2 family protein [Chloroflexi bacterium]|uniref:DNA-3-methyladenine glycosylase family protein n=1 Tax=Candidatus Flexifilum breve TaxID=3140694 RepID=UPI0031359AEA|nr:DNA-3-methyladenine glycosylase 2 family protein [Chloroflexota bacterium]